MHSNCPAVMTAATSSIRIIYFNLHFPAVMTFISIFNVYIYIIMVLEQAGRPGSHLESTNHPIRRLIMISHLIGAQVA
jgi:hypothetical protein